MHKAAFYWGAIYYTGSLMTFFSFRLKVIIEKWRIWYFNGFEWNKCGTPTDHSGSQWGWSNRSFPVRPTRLGEVPTSQSQLFHLLLLMESQRILVKVNTWSLNEMEIHNWKGSRIWSFSWLNLFSKPSRTSSPPSRNAYCFSHLNVKIYHAIGDNC